MNDDIRASLPRRPLNIGFITNYHLECVGGAEEAYDRLAALWQATGHRVTLFSTPPRADRAFHRRPWEPTYEVVSLPRPRSTRFGLKRYVKALERRHAEESFDVIFAGDTYWAGFVGHWFAVRNRVPHVVNCQGVGLIEGCRFAKRWLTRRRIAAAIGHADSFVAPSRYIHQRAIKLTTLRGRSHVIPNGWPDEWATQAIAPTPLVGRYVFGMGRLIPLKGFHTLIDAMTLLRDKHPDVGLVIAGNGDALPELVAQAKACSWPTTEGPTPPATISGATWFPGFVHGDAKRSLIAGAEAAVSPSIRQEPMSLALFEMLSCGVPVVGSNVGGTPDIVVPDVNGELFAAESSTELASKLDRLLAKPAYRANLASAAKPSVDAHRWSKVAARFLDVFYEVVSIRSARAA